MNSPSGRWRSSRSPWLADVALAVVVAAVDVAATAAASSAQSDLRHPGGLGYVLVVLAALPLGARRRWPRSVFGLTLAPTLIYLGVGYANGPVAVPVILALYTLALVVDRRRSTLVAVTTVVALVVVKAIQGTGLGEPHYRERSRLDRRPVVSGLVGQQPSGLCGRR